MRTQSMVGRRAGRERRPAGRLAAALVLLAALAAAASAAPLPTPPKSPEAAPAKPRGDADVRELLGEQIDLDFERISLDGALRRISQLVPGLGFIADPELQDEGFDLKQDVVSLKLKQVPVSDILRLILGIELTYVIEPGGVRIVTREKVLHDLPEVTYRVDTILQRCSRVPGTPWGEAGLAKLASVVTLLVSSDGDPFVSVWAKDKGPASIRTAGDSLVVVQSRRGQELIAALLKQLEVAANNQLPDEVPLKVDPPTVAETRARLDATVDLSFKGGSLNAFLKRVSWTAPGLYLAIDRAIYAADIDPAKRAVKAVEGRVRIADGLRSGLAPDLDYAVRPGYVVVTTLLEKYQMNLVLGAYPIGGLIKRQREEDEPGAQAQAIMDRLYAAVSNLTDPEVAKWQQSRGPASLQYFGGVLLAVQTHVGHQKIQEALAKIQKPAGAK